MKYSCIRGFVFLMALFLAMDSLAGSKIDTIYFQQGDRITGEVKSLANNQLKLSTDDAKTISVEWNKVDSVKILNNMRIVLENGEILNGKILSARAEGQCYVWSSEEEPRRVSLVLIVSLSPLADQFMKRINGTLSSGFSYVKANKVMQTNFSGSVSYQAEKNRIELSYFGIFTNDPVTGTTQRQDGGATLFRLFPRNWFLVSSASLENNSELQLDLRTSLSLGGGNSIVNSNVSRLLIAMGIQGTRENSSEDNQNNLEGLVVTNYSVFVYDNPEVSFNIAGRLIPSLSNLGRVRADIDTNLKWEIFSDFYLKWTFYYNFDSQPLSETAEKNDWAVTLLGVEYKL